MIGIHVRTWVQSVYCTSNEGEIRFSFIYLINFLKFFLKSKSKPRINRRYRALPNDIPKTGHNVSGDGGVVIQCEAGVSSANIYMHQDL
jgi:hypothetical protein